MSRRGHYKTYIQENLEKAVEKIKLGEISVGKASLAYGIPKTTLLDKMHGRTPLQTRQGPNPILTDEEELGLVTWIAQKPKMSYGRMKQELALMVKKILDENGRPNPFKKNTPGRCWMRGFLRRHPEISTRVPQPVAPRGKQGRQGQEPPAVSPSQSGAKNALEALESVISSEKLQLFQRWRQEEYDMGRDDLYQAWSALKRKAALTQLDEREYMPGSSGDRTTTEKSAHHAEDSNRPGPSGYKPARSTKSAQPTDADRPGPSGPKPATSKALSPSWVSDKRLQYPEASRVGKSKEKTNRKDSGETFTSHLIEKEQKKKNEEERRQKRQEERERKKMEAEAKKRKASKSKGKSKRTTAHPKHTTGDSDGDIEMVEENQCGSCHCQYDDNPENWIGCGNCKRWYHRSQRCSGLEGVQDMSDDDICKLEWLCNMCL
ncbi:uncharacterized protein LOC119735070 [Patiria miniata]|uniref:HTH CENPB-type domain-containing protein n=1 Tax=Patiria miniata TaxID=46514 RepID=A0A914AL13_PATMI|nr:uncharacterized protein LOC119735070 [Patiria miniata]